MQGQVITRTEPEADVPVSAGTTQVAKIQTLKNIHAFHLQCTGSGTGATYAQMIADIDAIRIVIGGQMIVNATPDFLWARYHWLNDAKTVIVPAGDVPITFMPDHLPWDELKKHFRIGMKANADPQSGLANNLQIEIDWASTVSTIDRCVPYIETDDDAPETIQDHIRILPFQSTHSAASKQDITTLDRESPIRAAMEYWFPLSTGTVSHMEVIENQSFRLRNVPVDVIRFQQHRAGRVHQSAWEVCSFTDGNDPSSIMPISSLTKFSVSPTWSVSPGGSYSLYQVLVCRGLAG